jgi:hypothetical protein
MNCKECDRVLMPEQNSSDLCMVCKEKQKESEDESNVAGSQ